MTTHTSRRFLLAAAALALSATLPAQAQTQTQTPIIIKFSHVAAVDTPKGKGALRFKELVEQRSAGKIKVEVYPNSQLYKDKEELEALQLGAVQMLAPSLSKFGPLGAKEFEVYDLPFLTTDVAAFRRVTQSPVARSMETKLETRGIKPLAYWEAGFRVMTANRPLHKVADFKGLKMRINSSRVIDAQMRALGAIPQVMPFSELYQGLQSGVVDGTETTLSNVWTQKLHEVQKHITLSNHSHQAYAVVANKKFWEGLPADLRGTLEAAMREATLYANAIAATEDEQALDRIKATGKVTVYTPTPAEIADWKKALIGVHKDMEGRVGRDTIQGAYAASGFSPASAGKP